MVQHRIGGPAMSDIPPVVRYLIVCEDVQTDPANPKRISLLGLLGTIHSLEEPPFPLLYREICVYLQVTGWRGPAEGRIEIQHADTGQVVFRTMSRNIPFSNNPLEIDALVFRIRNCHFQQPGLYWVQFWYNNQVIEQQPLMLR